jgi:hypothetical protein
MSSATLFTRLLPAVALVLSACGTGSNDEPLASDTSANPVQQADGTRWVPAGADLRGDASADLDEATSGGADAPVAVSTATRLQWGGWVPSITPQGLGRSGCAVRWSREFADADAYLAASRTARPDYWALSETWETLPAVAAVGSVRPAGGHVELDDARRMLTMVVPVDATAACPQGDLDAPTAADAPADARVAALAASAGNTPSAAVTAARKRWVQAFVAAALPELSKLEPAKDADWFDRGAGSSTLRRFLYDGERQRLAKCLAPALESTLANPTAGGRETAAQDFDTCIGQLVASTCPPSMCGPGRLTMDLLTINMRTWIGQHVGWLLQQGWQRFAPQLNRSTAIGISVSWSEIGDLGAFLAQANPTLKAAERKRWVSGFMAAVLPDTDRGQPLPARPIWLDRQASIKPLGRHLLPIERQRLASCLAPALERVLAGRDYVAHVEATLAFDRCIGKTVEPTCGRGDCGVWIPGAAPRIPSTFLRAWIRTHGNWLLQEGWNRHSPALNQARDPMIRVWYGWRDLDGLGWRLTNLRPNG